MNPLIAALGAFVALAVAAPATAADDALRALRAVTVDTPAAGLPFADVLQQAAQPEAATLLRLGLLTAHVEGLNGKPWAAGTTLGQVIDGAVALPAPAPDSALAAGWQRAFNRQVALRWDLTGGVLPQELAYLSDRLQPAGPGRWTMAASGLTHYVGVVALVNGGATPLPLPAFRLRLLPEGGLLLDCKPPALGSIPAGTAGAVLVDAGETVAPAAERAFVCRAVTEGRWRDAFGAGATAQFELLPPHFDSAERVAALASAIGSGSPVDRQAWAARFRNTAPGAAPARAEAAAPARRPAARASTLQTVLAVAGAACALLLLARLALGRAAGDPAADTVRRTLPLVAGLMAVAWAVGSPWGQDVLSAWTADTRHSLRDGTTALQRANEAAPTAWALDRVMQRFIDRFGVAGVGALVTIGVFAVGRGFVRRGASSGAVIIASQLLLGAAGLVLVVATWSAPSGEGWGRAAPLIVAGMWLVAAFWAGLGVAALHKLHDVLDRDGVTWLGAVTRAFRQALDFGGTASRGEFWGFLLAFALAWMLARAFLRPLDMAVALAGAVPLLALAVRRFRALDAREVWGLAALVGVLVLELLTGR